jgi:hypothetical protein
MYSVYTTAGSTAGISSLQSLHNMYSVYMTAGSTAGIRFLESCVGQ